MIFGMLVHLDTAKASYELTNVKVIDQIKCKVTEGKMLLKWSVRYRVRAF